MKKRTTTLIIIVASLAVLIGAYFLISGLSKETEDTKEETKTEITVNTNSKENAQKLAFKNSKTDASFSLVSGSWTYDGDNSFPLNTKKFDELLTAATQIKATRDITAEAQSDESVYGFDKPVLTVNLSYNDGTSDELIFGAENSSLSSQYLKCKNRIFLVPTSVSGTFNIALFDLLPTTDLQTISGDKMTSIAIDGTAVDDERFESLKTAYNSLSVGDVADYKNPEHYGFDGSEKEITVSYNEDTTVTAEDGSTSTDATITKTYSFRLANAGGVNYIRLPDDNLIYNVTGAEEFLK